MTNDEKNKLFGFTEECPNDTPEEELRVRPVKNPIRRRIKHGLAISFLAFFIAFLLLVLFFPIRLDDPLTTWWLCISTAGFSWTGIGWLVISIIE